MNNNDLKILSEGLINTFNFAGEESIRLYKEGLKIEIKKEIISITGVTIPKT